MKLSVKKSVLALAMAVGVAGSLPLSAGPASPPPSVRIAYSLIVQYHVNPITRTLANPAAVEALHKDRCLRAVPLGPVGMYVAHYLNDVCPVTGGPEGAEAALRAKMGNLAAYTESNYGVESFAHPAPLKPNDPFFPHQWGLEKIAAPNAWGLRDGIPPPTLDDPMPSGAPTDANAITVAVLDTGLDFTHPEWQVSRANPMSPWVGNVWVNKGETGMAGDGRDKATNGVDDDKNGVIDDSHGVDFSFLSGLSGKTGKPQDSKGHGTQVSGIIGARGNNSIGVSGVAWRTKIMPVQTHSATGLGTLATLIKGIHYAASNGARVINISGGYRALMPSAALQSVVNYATREKGALIVTAAGNGNVVEDFVAHKTYPCALAVNPTGGVLCVGSTTPEDKVTSHSNVGYPYVKLYAPGENILTTTVVPPGSVCMLMVGALCPGYGSLSGTSAASGFAAGAAALAMSRLEGNFGRFPMPPPGGDLALRRVQIAQAVVSRMISHADYASYPAGKYVEPLLLDATGKDTGLGGADIGNMIPPPRRLNLHNLLDESAAAPMPPVRFSSIILRGVSGTPVYLPGNSDPFYPRIQIRVDGKPVGTPFEVTGTPQSYTINLGESLPMGTKHTIDVVFVPEEGIAKKARTLKVAGIGTQGSGFMTKSPRKGVLKTYGTFCFKDLVF